MNRYVDNILHGLAAVVTPIFPITTSAMQFHFAAKKNEVLTAKPREKTDHFAIPLALAIDAATMGAYYIAWDLDRRYGGTIVNNNPGMVQQYVDYGNIETMRKLATYIPVVSGVSRFIVGLNARDIFLDVRDENREIIEERRNRTEHGIF